MLSERATRERQGEKHREATPKRRALFFLSRVGRLNTREKRRELQKEKNEKKKKTAAPGSRKRVRSLSLRRTRNRGLRHGPSRQRPRPHYHDRPLSLDYCVASSSSVVDMFSWCTSGRCACGRSEKRNGIGASRCAGSCARQNASTRAHARF